MLYFDEATHTYLLNDKPLRSVSSIVASQFRKFNATLMARNVAKSKASDPDSCYFGMTEDEVLKRWNESSKVSRDAGTFLHRQIEEFYKYGWEPDDKETPEWKQFTEFREVNRDWICLATEMRVHNGDVAGTIDAVFDTPEGIVLVDWKRTKSIDFSGFGMGKDVMRHVPDCNYSKYSLQLSLYRRLFKPEVKACYIIQIHPSLETYQKIPAQYFSVEADYLLV